jgi:beta-galactosidase
MQKGSSTILLSTAALLLSSSFVNAQVLYIGANYHPHDDRNPDKIKRDIELMKAAGFNVVRMGHLAWDSYEPAEGQFDFGWFDGVMARQIDTTHFLYLNVSGQPRDVPLKGRSRSILYDKEYNGNVTIAPYEPDFIEIK